MARKEQRREVASRVATFADLPDALSAEILKTVSLKTEGFSHALVSRKWRDLATSSLVAFKACCKTREPIEEEIMDEMKAFPNITNLTVTSAKKLTDSFLQFVATHCSSLRSFKDSPVTDDVPWFVFTPQGWDPFTRSCSSLTFLDLCIPSSSNCWLPCNLQGLQTLSDLKLKIGTDLQGHDSFALPTTLTSLQLTIDSDLDCRGSHRDTGNGDVGTMLRNLLKPTWELRELRKLHVAGIMFCFMMEGDSVDIPPAISSLTKLRDLALNIPLGPDSLPQEITYLSSLRSLSITCNCLCSLPPSLGMLSCITALSLDCSVLRELPPTMTTWTQLKRLRLDCPRLLNASELVTRLQPGGTLRLCMREDPLPQLSRQLQESIHSLVFHSFIVPQEEEDGQNRQGPLHLPSLRTLEMSEVEGFPLQVQSLPALRQLRVLNLDSPSNSVPSCFSICPALQVLHIRLCDIRSIPESIGNLTMLQVFCLWECNSLLGLPPSVGQLSALTSLEISNCPMFGELPDTVGNLSNLQELSIAALELFMDLPSSIGQLERLTALHLRWLPMLSTRNLRFSKSSHLQMIEIKRCHLSRGLLETLGNLRHLRTLELRDCSGPDTVPRSFQELASLRSLSLQGLQNLERLPAGMSRLTGLRDLTLTGLVVRELPQGLSCLTGLRFLHIKAWKELKALPPGLVEALPHLLEESQIRLRAVEGELQRAEASEVSRVNRLASLRSAQGSSGNGIVTRPVRRSRALQHETQNRSFARSSRQRPSSSRRRR